MGSTSGKCMESGTCSHGCSGFQKLNDTDNKEICSKCRHTIDVHVKKCTSCNGKATVIVPCILTSGICPKTTCPTCNGTGRIKCHHLNGKNETRVKTINHSLWMDDIKEHYSTQGDFVNWTTEVIVCSICDTFNDTNKGTIECETHIDHVTCQGRGTLFIACTVCVNGMIPETRNT